MFPGNFFGHRYYARRYFTDPLQGVVEPPIPPVFPPFSGGGGGNAAGPVRGRPLPDNLDPVPFLTKIAADSRIKIAAENPIIITSAVFVKIKGEPPIFIAHEDNIGIKRLNKPQE